jgi:ribosomal-protein-alanine N-acetyltransferase
VNRDHPTVLDRNGADTLIPVRTTATKQIIGTCAFKGAPTKEKTVEIAYFTFPEFEGKGYATAMASLLIHAARSSPEVERVIAHTLPETNASTRILQKVGMQFAGEVVDPEDGRVWRWSLDKEPQASLRGS